MAKPEWGTKRTCPKCSVRFYDLGKEEPLRCIDCGHEWKHEPILKTKQLNIADVKKVKEEKTEEDLFLEAEDDDEEVTPADNEDDITVESLDDNEDDVTAVIDTPTEKGSSE